MITSSKTSSAPLSSHSRRKPSRKPSATVEYQIVNATTNQPVVDFTEKTEQMGNVGDQLTLQKSLPINNLGPGVYQVTIKVNDLISNQTISPTVKFAVE